MANFEYALADFGRELGVDALALGPSNAVQLRFDQDATLGFFAQEEQLVLHWSEPVRYDAPSLLLRAFKRASNPPAGEPALQVGLRTVNGMDHLVLATRLQERDCSGRALRQLTDWLRQYLAALRN